MDFEPVENEPHRTQGGMTKAAKMAVGYSFKFECFAASRHQKRVLVSAITAESHGLWDLKGATPQVKAVEEESGLQCDMKKAPALLCLPLKL